MLTPFSRTELLFGKENMDKLQNSRVLVFGIGGVGGYVVEALARSGVGALDIVDDDKVSLTNINRQIYALHSTVGKYKVDVAEERIHDINPDCKVTKYQMFFLPETADKFNFKDYDYVVDCIDTVSGKIQIIMQAKESDAPVISCMGAGNKVDPSQFRVADISRTSVCPLARVIRKELKARGVEHLKVIYSTEPVIHSNCDPELTTDGKPGKQTPGSNAFTPSVAGFLIAGEVIRDLTEFHVTDLLKSESDKAKAKTKKADR